MTNIDPNSQQTVSEADLSIEQRLNMQTAKISWAELAKFFAAGKAIYVSESLDLIEVAAAMHRDDSHKISKYMQNDLVAIVSDVQAQLWHEQSAELWAVVVSPWVCVQPPK